MRPSLSLAFAHRLRRVCVGGRHTRKNRTSLSLCRDDTTYDLWAAMAARSTRPRSTSLGERRAAFQAVLRQHPRAAARRGRAVTGLYSPGGHRAHDDRRRQARLSWELSTQAAVVRRSAEAGGLPRIRGREVARHAVRRQRRPEGQLAVARGFDRFLRHHPRRGQFHDPSSLVRDNTTMISPYADPDRTTSRKRTTTPTQSPTTRRSSLATTPATTRTTVLPLRHLHGASWLTRHALAGRHREVQGQIRRRL